jgi:NAD(P)-dependent dehydrogenase (short-subunit alcohol dehydrogenase family)
LTTVVIDRGQTRSVRKENIVLGLQRKSTPMTGKVAVITGGSKGLGAATARHMHARGAKVAIVDLDEPRKPMLSGPPVMVVTGDVTQPTDLMRAADEVRANYGRIDYVIANAGVAARGATLHASSPDAVQRLLDVNVGGVLNTIHAFLPSLIDSRGHLVLVSSVFAYLNGAGTIPYAMSKAAVEQLGRGLRVELSLHDVAVTTAYFALIQTDMIRRSIDSDPTAQALLDGLPRLLRPRINADQAAKAIVTGIERGHLRTVRPRRWAVVSAMRGVLAPVLDAQMTRDASTQALMRELDNRQGQDRLTTSPAAAPDCTTPSVSPA